MTNNIILYNRVLCYLRSEATESVQQQIDRTLLHFFNRQERTFMDTI